MRETISKNSSSNNLKKLDPLNSISSGFGLMKFHKPNKELRLIITHYDSIVANSQIFIKNLIQTLAKDCKFAIDSPKKFKERFIPDSLKFDSTKHKIVSIDACKLFTSINVNRTISHILEIIQITGYFFQGKR